MMAFCTRKDKKSRLVFLGREVPALMGTIKYVSYSKWSLDSEYTFEYRICIHTVLTLL